MLWRDHWVRSVARHVQMLAKYCIGKMSMTIPPFVQIEHDFTARKATIDVENREIRKQREMWGMRPVLHSFQALLITRQG